MAFNKVDDFLAKLAQQTPKAKSESKTTNRALEKIYLNYQGNLGRYQVLPLDNVVTDFPFTTLFGTREICIPRKNVTSDGQENVYNAWIHILPKSAYVMKDMTGRVVSSLTAEEDQLLSQAYMVFDQLFGELDARNNRDLSKDLIRMRNYTVFHAMCLNKWDINDSRTPNRQNFCGLFVCTAKGFINAVNDNIEERTLMNGNDNSWIPSIYNRQLTGRDGFLMFSISQNKLQAGYSVTVSHEIGRAKALEGVSISEEDAELMMDPVASFLGWQANRESSDVAPQQRRLFNASLIREAIEFMSQQVAAIKMAKNTGMDVTEAIQKTNETALAQQHPTTTQGQPNDDQKLADMASQSSALANNTKPFQTPPTAHINPITSAPESPAGNGFGNHAPYTAPAFGGGFGNNNNGGGLPF